ncbi:MAG TPA: GAF domain-containing sensor histidine kinase [Rubrobacter sp.]|nr:GAF domain-containing sensor histidine kinase [Rubrobacter sp.]
MSHTPASTPSGASPVKPLSGLTLVLARGTWLVVAVLALGFFAAGIPSEFVMFHTVCQDACLGGQVTQAGSRALRDLGLSLDFYAAYAVVHDVVFAAVYVAVAVIIFWRKSDERMALLASFALLTFGTAGLPNTTYALSIEYASLWWPLSLLDFLGAASFGLFLYHFPDGRFVPGWTRWPVFAWIAWQLPAYWFPSWDSFDLDGWTGWLTITVWTAFLGTMIYTQTYRYLRVSGATERQQIKWVVFGISVAALVYFGVAVGLSPFAPAPRTPGMVVNVLIGYTFLYAAMLLVPLSIGFAILRHHLFDINLIINRTLVYGALTASVVALYVLVVGALGQVLQVSGNLIVSLIATGLTAVLFQPLRIRLQRGVNHLMYGERDEPYAVLSRLGQRLEATLTPDAMLPTVARTVAEALKLPYVAIEIGHDGPMETTAIGKPVENPVRLPLTYGGDTVGQIVLGPRAGGTFTPADAALLEDLAHQTAIAVHAVTLHREAVRLSADLQRSRELLVTAREEERRRLRRDLHDGLGPRLAAQSLKVGSARMLYDQDPNTADMLLSELEADIEATLFEIRRLVYDLRPPALDELGLVGAIRDAAEHHTSQAANGLDISVNAPNKLPPLSAAAEVASYRIVQEALANVTHHASATDCVVRLTVTNELRIEVSDDGIGIPKNHRYGVGLHSMRERAEELGGTCIVGRSASGGTRVLARLPLPDREKLASRE